MSASEPKSSRFWEQVFPGFGIGLLVGLLVGLSVSPVVAGVLTTLGGLLAAILGIQPGADDGSAKFRVNGTRIGAFGLACVLGVLGGVTLRVKDVFATPVKQQVAEWVAAGYDETEARQMVAFQKTGLIRSTKTGEKLEVASADAGKHRSSVLYASLSDIDMCEDVKLSQFGGDPSNQAPQMLAQYHLIGKRRGDPKSVALYQKLDSIAGRVKSQSMETQIEVFRSVEDMVCTIQALE